MKRLMKCLGLLGMLFLAAPPSNGQQIGKYVPIPAGSDADHALTEINAATEPAQKLTLIDKFSADLGKGDMEIIADDLYVNYYLAQKNYDKVFEYGDKLFAVDPGNLQNEVNMIRAANEKGDPEKVLAYGQKLPGILKLFQDSPAPAGVQPDDWQRQKAATLEGNKDNIHYVEEAVYMVEYRTPNAATRAEQLTKFAQMFPDSPYANQALGVAAASYQQAQNVPKMLEVANGLLTKDPNNIGMLLLISDYYSEKGEHLDQAESSAKKAIAALAAAQKPEGVADNDWQKEISLQKGLALCALGQVSIQKKENAQAVENFKAAAPLLQADPGSYGRNQYWLGFALVNLRKNAEAKVAFSEAASVNGPYRALAQAKLKTFAGARN
ncbi:MAG TPA: hypothetical protein VJN93_06985 [Candidatus Acidoferrum sp.]|nr:hypothetical protein [Candidatus Acidoferrum sp.]